LGLGLALLREGGIGSGRVVDGSVVTHDGRDCDFEMDRWRRSGLEERKRESGNGRI
jgi:hypothetical protein